MSDKINIMVIGSGNDSAKVIKALEKIHGKNVYDVTLSNNEDIEPAQQKALDYVKPKQNNQWRGGSRGKGGKTKWPRR